MEVLALDFDGVICDSAREVFRVGLSTYLGFHPDSPLAERLGAAARSGVQSNRIYQQFLDLCPLGNRAEDFGVALRAIDCQIKIKDQAAYDRFYESLDPQWLEAFHVRFYEERNALREGDPDGWLEMQAPFTEFTDLLPRISEHVRLAVVTAKDGRSVRVLLKQFGIDSLFLPELILDKDTGVHKINHLKTLQSRAAVPFDRITFVDDKVNHLFRVAELGVQLILAGWGLNGEREHSLAREDGIVVATFANAESVFLGKEVP
jgi:phosphoglycolate phosphatase-like HAD superfamily hydrolase